MLDGVTLDQLRTFIAAVDEGSFSAAGRKLRRAQSVVSQTLANLTALDDAVSLPVLRPLIGHDKIEIIGEARRIGTLALSELPDQDCCTLLTPRQVETRARIEDLRRIEARMDADDLAEDLAAAAQEHTPARS